MKVTRREFMKIAGLAAGVGVGANWLLPSALAIAENPQPSELSVATNCEMCHWACGAIAKVVDGKVVKLDGNPLHPNSRGKLCARGNSGMGLLYDPDRVKTPLIRTGSRGEGKYKKASWDEALNYVAEKMLAIKQNYGPEAVSFFGVGACSLPVLPLFAAFGSPNYAQPSFGQCRGACWPSMSTPGAGKSSTRCGSMRSGTGLAAYCAAPACLYKVNAGIEANRWQT